MVKGFIIVLFAFCALNPLAVAQTVSIGSYSIGYSSVNVDLNDFEFLHSNKKIQTEFLPKTIQWIRSEKNLLTPQALLKIEAPKEFYPLNINYQDQSIVAITNSSDTFKAEFYVNLFSPGKIQVFHDKNLIDEITIVAQTKNNTESKQWIDTSCTPYSLIFNGLPSDYVSVGCNLKLVGSFGDEKPRLEVALSSTNLKSPMGTNAPFVFYFDKSGNTKTRFVHAISKKEVEVEVQVELPSHISRLKLAGGIGPYTFKNKNATSSHSSETTLSYMLYGKLNLTETTSLKAFNALIYDKTLFNNAGLYYSFELSRFFDGRVVLGTLLGFQGLHYRYDQNSRTHFEMIYPQGFELTYLHPFGQQNYYLNYGMFISTTGDIYRNIWLRYGKKIFYEANYIAWGKDLDKIDMFGLSVGFPLIQFF